MIRLICTQVDPHSGGLCDATFEQGESRRSVTLQGLGETPVVGAEYALTRIVPEAAALTLTPVTHEDLLQQHLDAATYIDGIEGR